MVSTQHRSPRSNIVSLGLLEEVSSVTHVALVGRFDLVVRHAFRLLIRGGDSPGRVVWEQIFRRARVLLLSLESSVSANSGSVQKSTPVLKEKFERLSTHFDQKNNDCKMAGSVVSKLWMGDTQPCSLPWSNLPKTHRFQSVSM